MKVYVKTITGEIFTIEDISQYDSVATIRASISERFGTKSKSQRLLFCGNELDGNKMVMEYNILDESTLHLVQDGFFLRKASADPSFLQFHQQQIIARLKGERTAGTSQTSNFSYTPSDSSVTEQAILESMSHGESEEDAIESEEDLPVSIFAIPEPSPPPRPTTSSSSKWTGDSGTTPFFDIRDSRFQSGLAADAATLSLLSVKPVVNNNLLQLCQNKEFCIQILGGLAAEQGCSVSIFDSKKPQSGDTRTTQNDDMQYISSLAPSSGVTDAKDIKQLLLLRPDDLWEGVSTQDIMSDSIARMAFIESVRLRMETSASITPGDVEIIRVCNDGDLGGMVFTFFYRGTLSSEELHVAFQREFTSAYKTLKVHPLHTVLNFDLSCLNHSAGATKDFASENSTHQVGPTGKQRPYHQPWTWVRIGLNVLGKFVDGDTWLAPFQHASNWYRAYHGTSRNHGAAASAGGGGGGAVGGAAGVQVSPHVEYAMRQSGDIHVEFRDGSQRLYKCVIMCAVRTDSISAEGVLGGDPARPTEHSTWLVAAAADVRPYGILIKEKR